MLENFTQFAAESEEAGIAALGIDPVAILLQTGTFLLLFFLIKKYALEKINKALSDREQTINEGVKNAQKAEQAVARATEKQEEMLKAARKEADEIIAKAHTESGELVAQAEQRATEKAEKIASEAEARLDESVAKARTELRGELVELVIATTETILGEKLDSKNDAKLLAKAIKETTK